MTPTGTFVSYKTTVYARPVSKGDGSSDIMKWEAGIPGKEDTDWAGGTFKVSMEFSEDYPSKPPKCKSLFFFSSQFEASIHLHLAPSADGSYRACSHHEPPFAFFWQANLFHLCSTPTSILLGLFAYRFLTKKRVGVQLSR